jgi:hypothetical protein
MTWCDLGLELELASGIEVPTNIPVPFIFFTYLHTARLRLILGGLGVSERLELFAAILPIRPQASRLAQRHAAPFRLVIGGWESKHTTEVNGRGSVNTTTKLDNLENTN